MGDHSETLQVNFDPTIISFADIVDMFWNNHRPVVREYGGRQYLSILFYEDQEQQEIIAKKKLEWEQQLSLKIETEIVPLDHFFNAEERHQKYYLKRWPSAVEALRRHYPSEEDLVSSTLAARLNGFVKGYGTIRHIKEEIVDEWNLSTDAARELVRMIDSIRW